ncbi:MAG: hypothetical protein ACRD6X_21980, partial [Pyrinomonadaceae bacterium]
MKIIACILFVALVCSACVDEQRKHHQNDQTLESNTVSENDRSAVSVEMLESNTHERVEQSEMEPCGWKGNSDPFKLPIISKNNRDHLKVIASVVEAFNAD